jgi:hypothetical protein
MKTRTERQVVEKVSRVVAPVLGVVLWIGDRLIHHEGTKFRRNILVLNITASASKTNLRDFVPSW